MWLDGVQGHLVTIGSAEENAFVFDTLIGPTDANWLGGFQPESSDEPDGGWQWLMDEPFDYTNWNPRGEPNDQGGESVLHMPAADGGFWNDVNGLENTANVFVVEFDVPEPGSCVVLLVVGSIVFMRSGMVGRMRVNVGT